MNKPWIDPSFWEGNPVEAEIDALSVLRAAICTAEGRKGDLWRIDNMGLGDMLAERRI